ncbi:tyrosine-type recombinase/integrase [Tropicibacter alexandrii]|uniref:tyrosine-type recombinase/integrase n=1 Tax=Tropicibacter alexandrii TaxID=2267683 RepID=UPI000EF53012|nr:tyrosine-type recombinase/integrase [Tropicibacter alexandrii]
MKKRNPFPGVGNKPNVDQHGKKRWRLRAKVNGRKVDEYLPGAYGSLEFRTAYEAAMNPRPDDKRTRGEHGTVDHVVSHYRGSVRFKELAASTRYAKGKRLDWICQIIGRFPLELIQAHHIEGLMEKKGGAAAANRLRKELSEIFDHARKKVGLDIANPVHAVDERKQKETGGFHTWTPEEIQKYRDFHPSGTKARRALELMLATGAARQDACAMGRHNIKGNAIYYRRGKTGQEAELSLDYMPDLVAEIIQLPPGTSLFLTRDDGKPYTVEGFGNWFADQVRAAGLPDRCRAHGLRKFGATQLAEHGANELEIMAFLAHRSTREALTYVKSAQRKKLSAGGMSKVRAASVSNLSEWLDKSAPQVNEKKGK